MKVKIFHGSPKSVESRVREFVSSLGITDFYKIMQSESTSDNYGGLNLTITIFYTE